MLRALSGLLLATVCVVSIAACEPPKVVPRCPGFEDLTCPENRRTLCVVAAADGCQKCVCERAWSDDRTDPAPPGAAKAEGSASAGGEGEGEGEGERTPEGETAGGEGEAERTPEGDTAGGEGEGEG